MPDGDLLGVDSVAEADLVLVPALAVGADGTPLGRGGGSYDRALARVPAGAPWSRSCTTASCCPAYRPNRTTAG